MRKIRIGSRVKFKNEYRKIAEKLGLKRILTVKSIDSDGGVKFIKDKKPEVTIAPDWLQLLKKQKRFRR